MKNMTTNDLKSEIKKSLDNVPESILQDVLSFLHQAEKQPENRITLVRNLKKILEEDQVLLERLAK